MKDKFILDMACGPKHIWVNKNHPNTLYIDIRREEKGYIKTRVNREVNPDMIVDNRDMPFKNKEFKLIIWDPPHIKSNCTSGAIAKQYGVLNPETWEDDLKKGFDEAWRVLDNYGTLIIKWNECHIPYKTILSLFSQEALFGTRTTQKSKSETRFFTFMKIPNDVIVEKGEKNE